MSNMEESSAANTPPAVSRPRTRTVGIADSAKVERAAAMAKPEMSTPRPVSDSDFSTASCTPTPCASSW